MKLGIAVEQKGDGLDWGSADTLQGSAMDSMIWGGGWIGVIANIPGTIITGQELGLVPYLHAFLSSSHSPGRQVPK